MGGKYTKHILLSFIRDNDIRGTPDPNDINGVNWKYHLTFDCSICNKTKTRRFDKLILSGARCSTCPKKEEDSAASIKKVRECWNYELNEGKKPREVYKSSGSKIWITCPKCPHNFPVSMNKVNGRGHWCPYCANQKLCKDENCNICYKKSAASIKKVRECWNYELNEGKKPRDVFKNSHSEIWFTCPRCPHDFPVSMNKVSSRGNWCPYCSNPPNKLCKDENCGACWDKSFASSEMSKHWHPNKNGKLVPRDVFKKSNSCCRNFICPYCEKDYKAIPQSVTNGSWCNCRINKTETLLHKWLLNRPQKYDVERGVTYEWCKDLNPLPFDFVIESLKLIFELDGPHHYDKTAYHYSGSTIVHDRYKEKMALKHGYTVIRIKQEDVWNNENDWESKLLYAIGKDYEEPTVNKLYDECIELF